MMMDRFNLEREKRSENSLGLNLMTCCGENLLRKPVIVYGLLPYH